MSGRLTRPPHLTHSRFFSNTERDNKNNFSRRVGIQREHLHLHGAHALAHVANRLLERKGYRRGRHRRLVTVAVRAGRDSHRVHVVRCLAFIGSSPSEVNTLTLDRWIRKFSSSSKMSSSMTPHADLLSASRRLEHHHALGELVVRSGVGRPVFCPVLHGERFAQVAPRRMHACTATCRSLEAMVGAGSKKTSLRDGVAFLLPTSERTSCMLTAMRA
ncbi:unnamed protein product [Pleuronectes platessa]|uniref:Uncharacterized protein n=1 Tax=Pleuronectes platessa TaxID=8262 RepID=A0A9N7UIF2_PLEPL|nr:unnamed protein product [Pleuronectes platessa]